MMLWLIMFGLIYCVGSLINSIRQDSDQGSNQATVKPKLLTKGVKNLDSVSMLRHFPKEMAEAKIYIELPTCDLLLEPNKASVE